MADDQTSLSKTVSPAAMKPLLRGQPRILRAFRRVLIFAVVGVLLTYAAMLVAVLILPMPTMDYGCRGGILRPDLDGFRPYLRARIWEAPHGAYFQIHVTRGKPSVLEDYFDFSKMSEDEKQAVMENPSLRDPTVVPAWSLLQDSWPNSLHQITGVLERMEMWYELRMGWPLPCLRGSYVTTARDKTVACDGAVTLQRLVDDEGPWAGFMNTVGLPLIPDWPPFLASVALYGFAAFVAAASPRFMRRLIRRRRGACLECGYDLRGSADRCPECGSPIARENESRWVPRAQELARWD